MSSPFNYLFVSDLHLSEGVSPQTGSLHRNEDFFHDSAFAQFLAYHVQLSRDAQAKEYYERPWKLIINGDIFDFLQVVSKPPVNDKGEVVIDAIDADGQPYTVTKKLSDNERRFGLGTSEAEIVWKLDKVAEGHPRFFQALAWFLAHEGNELVMMKGNHDIELFWPAVQKRMAQLLVNAYAQWHSLVEIGDRGELPLHFGLPDSLTVAMVETAVTFPSSFYYEEGVFYAEHGCQYDPANWFPNFEDPRLPQNETYLELPSGSLFVRYFFNSVEHIHPFADNIKPITKYIMWLLRHAPDSAFTFVFELLPGYLRAAREVSKKLPSHEKENREVADSDFERGLFAIQNQIRAGLEQGSGQTKWRMILSIVMVAISVILALSGIRFLALGSYIWMTAVFITAISAYFFSSYLFQSVDKLLADPFLYQAANQIGNLLNSGKSDPYTAVPYIVFGHDHAATVRALDVHDNENKPPFRQWYVNTGAWVPVFSEEDRLLRDDEQLTFLRIVPTRIGSPMRSRPELLQWPIGGNAPASVRLFG